MRITIDGQGYTFSNVGLGGGHRGPQHNQWRRKYDWRCSSGCFRGESIRDLGSLVARMVIEALGGSVELDGETLRVRL